MFGWAVVHGDTVCTAGRGLCRAGITTWSHLCDALHRWAAGVDGDLGGKSSDYPCLYRDVEGTMAKFNGSGRCTVDHCVD